MRGLLKNHLKISEVLMFYFEEMTKFATQKNNESLCATPTRVSHIVYMKFRKAIPF